MPKKLKRHWSHTENHYQHVCHAARNNFPMRAGETCKYCFLQVTGSMVAASMEHWRNRKANR